MRPTLVITLIVTLTLPACAPALATLSADQADIWRRTVEQIPIGSAVTIRTTPGERFTGVVLAIDSTGLDVSPRTRVPEPIRRVQFNQIAHLEQERMRAENLYGKVAGIAGAIGAGAAFGMMMLLLAVYDD
jgi:hypothetical protein